MSEVRYFTWISEAIPKGNIAVDSILERYDSAKAFYEDCKSDIDKLDFLSPQLRKSLAETPISVADEILNNCERLGIKVLCPTDESYSKRLLNISGIPPVLYYVGDISCLNDYATIGVVGTRKPLNKSKQITGNICKNLSNSGIVVVSGCAVGIDEYAHRGAIKANGKTVAVLACGLDVNYPKPNARIKNKLLKLGGLLVSEQPPGAKPLRGNFPCRNRIIAGLSDSVFVVEAPEKSGSLITADHAVSQGKDVFCLSPLGFRDKRFQGCVKYLRSGGIPVFDVSDILYKYYLEYTDKLDFDRLFDIIENEDALPIISQDDIEQDSIIPYKVEIKSNKNTTSNAINDREKPEISGVSEVAINLYDTALSFTPKRVEELSQASGLTVAEILAALTELEIMGIVSQSAGSMYYIQ